MVRPILIFSKSSSITDYIQFYDSDSSFTMLATLFFKTAHKNTSFLCDYSDYADLHENHVITDYSYYTEIQDSMKNGFITESADYLVFNTKG